MKKVFIGASVFLAPFLVQAQDFNLGGGTYVSGELVRIFSMILVLYLFISLILGIMRTILEHRLKSKLVDKGVSEKIVDQFLQPTKRDSKTGAIKIFLVLFGLGTGLMIVNYTLPFGFHSVAVISFSIALSFLGYFWYLKQSGS